MAELRIHQEQLDEDGIRQLIDCHHGDFRTTPGFI